MPDARRIFGNRGEDLAASYLKEKGLNVIARQYGSSLGEIDVIAKDGEEIVFVEVKTRTSRAYGYPEESVTKEKVRHILRTAHQYLSEQKAEERPWRVDVIAIEILPDEDPRITHFPAIDMPEAW